MNSEKDVSNLVELCRVWGDAEALVIRGLLEESGIPCHFTSHADHSVHPFSLDGLGEVRISVSAANLEAAKSLVRDLPNE